MPPIIFFQTIENKLYVHGNEIGFITTRLSFHDDFYVDNNKSSAALTLYQRRMLCTLLSRYIVLNYNIIAAVCGRVVL